MLELRVCACGSTISAPFSHKSSTLVVAPRDSSDPVLEPPLLFSPDASPAMLVQVEPNRFQVRCSCMRTSPIIPGTRAVAKRVFEDLAWHLRGDEWTCPICAERKESGTVRASEKRIRAAIRTGT